MTVTDDELGQTLSLVHWIDLRATEYPKAYDDRLAPLHGKVAFDKLDVATVYGWKFRNLWAQQKITSLDTWTDEEVSSLTARAFSCSDELGALLILTLLPGTQAAAASALLMAHDSERFTVMDTRAINSLAVLGLWDKTTQGVNASAYWWPEYLMTCRELSASTGRRLRTVDRALWQANGNN